MVEAAIAALHKKPPFWLSAGWTSFLLTIATLIAGMLLGAPEAVLVRLADGILIGLPILIGGGKYVDHARAKALGAAVAPAGATGA